MRTTLLILLTVSACSQQVDSGGNVGQINSPTPGSGALTIETFIEQLDIADCAHAYSCKADWDDAAEGQTWGSAYGADAQDCLEGDQDYQQRAAYQQSVDDGNIVFDAAQAAACLSDLQFPSSCTAYFDEYDYPASCYDAIVGQVLPGNVCETTYDCYGNHACLGGSCTR